MEIPTFARMTLSMSFSKESADFGFIFCAEESDGDGGKVGEELADFFESERPIDFEREVFNLPVVGCQGDGLIDGVFCDVQAVGLLVEKGGICEELGVVAFYADGMLEELGGAFVVFFVGENDAQPVKGIGVCVVFVDGTQEAVDGIVQLVELCENRGHRDQDVGIGDVEFGFCFQICECFLRIFFPEGEFCQPVSGPCGGWVAVDGLGEKVGGGFGIVPAKGQFAEVKQCGREVGVELDDSVEFFFCGVELGGFQKKDSEIENDIYFARAGSELAEEVRFGEVEVALSPVCLCDSVVDLGVVGVELGGFLPAPDGLFELLAGEERVADVVEADWAVGVDLLCEVEHVLGLFVEVHFGVCDDSVAVARLEGGVE